ncbi:uroporphyrinogen-III synthase [Pseudonocardia sp. WMMC193]|uniref:uroporphyrinogen-III synthase n=1 Tax=Pseudonocardia sp. WMMC193 TaxID=2911965 RepID=UPI001F010FBE|nr:uroporphyrinogen-III synthase [Pseudonocardia sp. WMMC193]MCF7551085.1 uroporphyrinogen-III synthase [Pseudonocardia sp. WMMC193]
MSAPTTHDEAPVPALAGFTVGVTAARRAEELGTMLERRGATVRHGPCIRIVPLADDTDLQERTRDLIGRPPDVTVATTGVGFRGWVEAAAGWGVGEQLLTALGTSRILARGPKARGQIRAAGLSEVWSPASESSAEMLDHLLAEGVAGQRIAVQLHGEPLRHVVEALERAGAEVVTVPVYRWMLPVDPVPMDRLTDAVLAGAIDVLTFTSAPAASALLARAGERGLRGDLLAALRTTVRVLCVGPVTAAPLEALDVPTWQPERSRLGAMVRTLESAAPALVRRLPVAGHVLELRGHAVLVDGELKTVPPAGMAVLRALACRPGRVVPREELVRALPGDDHDVESAVARLGASLGPATLIQTADERGYRLAVDPAAGPSRYDDQHGEQR